MRFLATLITGALSLLWGCSVLLAAEQDTQSASLRPSVSVTNEFFSNLQGGLKTGTVWNGLIDLNCEIDLNKMGCPDGSAIIAQVLGIKNQHAKSSFADYTGAANPVSGLQAGDALRVFNLFYRRTWQDAGYTIKVGQIALDDDFMVSDFASLFVNSAFGAMPSQVATPLSSLSSRTPAFSVFAVAAPGVFLKARVSNSWTLQLAFYHGAPGLDDKDNHGFDWESEARPLVFGELAWKGECCAHESILRLGFSYHSGRFDDFDRLSAGIPNATTQGLANFYALQDFILLKQNDGRPKLGIFWRTGISPQTDRSVVSTYADLGLNWFGPLACRTEDVAGLALSSTCFGRDFRQFNGPDGAAGTETTIELTYLVRLNRNCILQLDYQALFQPAVDAASGRRETASIVGIRTEFVF